MRKIMTKLWRNQHSEVLGSRWLGRTLSGKRGSHYASSWDRAHSYTSGMTTWAAMKAYAFAPMCSVLSWQVLAIGAGWGSPHHLPKWEAMTKKAKIGGIVHKRCFMVTGRRVSWWTHEIHHENIYSKQARMLKKAGGSVRAGGGTQ